MTSKERVHTALQRREPDRVPTGEFATDHCVIDAVLGRKTYWRAKRRLIQAMWEGCRDEVVESQKRDIVDFTLKLGIDMVPVNLAFRKNPDVKVPHQIDEDTWEDEYGNILRYSRETGDIGIVQIGNKVPPPPESPPAPLPAYPDEDELEIVRYVIEKLGATHFIFARPGRAGIGFPSGFGLEKYYIRLAEDPQGVYRERMEGAERMFDAVKPFADAGVDAIAIGEDFGYNSGPFMSPRMFREVFFPAMKRQCEIIHDMGLYVLYHSCGDNRLILDQMVEAGMDCYQAIQPVEKIHAIKQLYGDRITLWGGVSSDSLCRQSPERIRQEVLFTLKHCAPGGGLILASSHSIMNSARPENYIAMIETLKERGVYPIDIPEDIPEPAWGPA